MPIEKTTLSIFLVRDSRIAELEKALAPGRGSEMVDGFDGRVMKFASRLGEPSWLTGVRTLVKEPDTLKLNTQAAGVMLLIRRAGLCFAVTLGIAWQRLRDEWLEPDFGRRVALVAIPRAQVVGLTLEQVFARWHVATERAPRASPLDEFSVESDRDLVSAIEGKPSAGNEALGDLIRGSTSLRVKIPIGDLAAALDHAAGLFKNGNYADAWPEMVNLMPIRGEAEIAACEAALDGALKGNRPERHIILSAPAARRGEAQAAESYVVGRLTRNVAIAPYLSFDSWTSHLRRKGNLTPSVQQARRTKVHLLDANNDAFNDCSIYECLGYEATVDDRVVILSSGVWYEVAKDFLSRINRTLSSMPAPKYSLPQWDGLEREGDYNRGCAKARRDLLLFDVKLISFGGGASRFEFCDLMHPGKRVLYFVKISSRSSDLSHLVEQTRRTVELLFDPDDGFRAKLKKKVRKEYPEYDVRWLDSRPSPGDWELCLVALGREAKDMPMFSKCSLARLVNDLRRRGHNVSFQAP